MDRRPRPRPRATWSAWSSSACRRRRPTRYGASWRTSRGDGVRTRPLTDVSAREARALLDAESDHWHGELSWAYRDVSHAVASGLERRSLTGWVVQDGPRSVAYCYSMLDGGRAIVGSLFAAAGFRGQGLEEALLDCVLPDRARPPGHARAE